MLLCLKTIPTIVRLMAVQYLRRKFTVSKRPIARPSKIAISPKYFPTIHHKYGLWDNRC